MILRKNLSIRLLAASIPMLVALACSSDYAPADETGTTGSASDTTVGSTPSAQSTTVTAATTETGPAGTASTGDSTDTAGDGAATTSFDTSATSSGETGTTDSGDVTSSGGTKTTGESSGGDTGSSETSADANSAPIILALSASPALLSGTGSVLIVAIVTDPDGISDVIGGTIASPQGTVYGALASSAEEGAYELELSWSELNTFVEINIDPLQTEEREFDVTLFDQGGASVTDSVSVTLESFFDGYAVCDGASVSLLSDTNCGVCGFSCLDDLGSQLGPGECSNGEWCEKSAQVSVYVSGTTCDAACAAAAGPQTPYSGTTDCQIVNGTCPFFPVPNPLGNCPGLSLNTIPSLGCVPADDETFLRCTCWGIYEP